MCAGTCNLLLGLSWDNISDEVYSDFAFEHDKDSMEKLHSFINPVLETLSYADLIEPALETLRSYNDVTDKNYVDLRKFVIASPFKLHVEKLVRSDVTHSLMDTDLLYLYDKLLCNYDESKAKDDMLMNRMHEILTNYIAVVLVHHVQSDTTLL